MQGFAPRSHHGPYTQVLRKLSLRDWGPQVCCPHMSACREDAVGGEDAGPADGTQTSAFPRAAPSTGLCTFSPVGKFHLCLAARYMPLC